MRLSVPSRYRVLQIQNVQLYERQPTPAIFLVPSTINLNYWTASDRPSPTLCSSLKAVAIFIVYSRLCGFLRHSVIISLRYYVLWRRVVWYMPTNLSGKKILLQSWTHIRLHSFKTQNPSSSPCSLRVRCVPCFLILKVELAPPSLLWSSNVPSSFWSVFQCLSWRSISVHPLYVL